VAAAKYLKALHNEFGDWLLVIAAYNSGPGYVLKAIKKSGTKDLSDYVLYTTVEPCFMCSYVIRETRIARVVFGAKAGGIGGVYSPYPLLTATDISRWQTLVQVDGGLLETDCLQWLQKAKG